MRKEIEATVAALSGDPALSGCLRSDAAVVAWDAGAEHVLWASEAARPFIDGLADSNGRIRTKFPDRDRLTALACGIGPRRGVKVERIRFSQDDGEPSEISCRLLDVAGKPVLLTIFSGQPPSMAGEDGAGAPAAGDEPSPAPFVERVRRHGRRRFIWSMDQTGRFLSISAPLGEVVGPENASLAGMTWDEALARLVIDPEGRLAECFAARSTWSDETVLWRVADTSYVVPVDLGGMPVFGRGHEFEGFRGFGLCRADEIQPAPDSPALRLAPVAVVETEEVQPEETTISPAADVDAGAGELEAADLAFGPLHAQVGAQLGGARSVPLRPVTSEAASRWAAAGRAETSVPSVEPKPFLSVAERGALHEIARALGARLHPDQDEPPPASRASAEIVPLSPGRPREPDALRILERLPVGVLVLRGDTALFANRTLLDLLDYGELGEIKGVSRIFTGRLDARQGAMTLLGKTGRQIPVDVRLSSLEWTDGPVSLLVVRALPKAGGEGEFARSLELEVARRDARIREYRAMFDIAGLAVVMIDPVGRIISANGPAERLFGYSENEVAGEGFTTLIAVDSHRAAIGLVDDARDGQEAPEVELFGRARSGNPIPLLARAGRVESENGVVTALMLRDVSGFRRTEAELTSARRSAEEAASRQAEFLARVSHEIRTPLNAIIGFAELMLEERFGPIGNERYKHYLRDIHDSGGHVVSLVNDLLDLAKVTAGRSELVFTSLDVNEIVGQSVSIMQPAATRERILMRTSFASGLPRLVADERSIRQVVLNLVSNAVRFTAAGGQVIVSTSLTDRGELVLRIRDTGVGMTPEEIQDAMEPFRQVSVVRRDDGTGLGLPLSKALVEANRGVFSLSSRRGEGTLVEVSFPAARVLAED